MTLAVLAALGLAIIALLASSMYQIHRRFHNPPITAPYQSVTLGNGCTFQGRIDLPGTDFLVLRDAFTMTNAVPQIALVPDA